jgi:hypothetical protein
LRNDGGNLTIEGCRFDHHHNQHWAAAIHTTGPTVIADTRFIENTSGDGGTGAIRASDTSTLTIERCRFSKNTGDEAVRISNVGEGDISQCSFEKSGDGIFAPGAGISVNNSTLRVTNCTITDGSARGIFVGDNAVTTVTHCTITHHGQVNRPGRGIIVSSNGTLNLRNSILAWNYDGPAGFNKDCEGILAQNVSNLIQDGSCNPQYSGDPKLGTLGYYGGHTKVFPLIQGSIAIDHANTRVSESVDQRGVARPIGPLPDIGAYEGSVLDLQRFIVNLIYRSVPYIIICDPLGEEVIDVAIAGSREVPSRSIVPASLTLGNAPAGSARVVGRRDVNDDGVDDLVLTFRLADVYRGASSCDAVTLLELQGQTRDRELILGYINVAATAGR